MNRFVIDASVAVKWLVTESGTSDALAVRRGAQVMAPDLLLAECANILWKKVQRAELSAEQAVLIARMLQTADIELRPMRSLIERAVQIAIELGHPVYDCLYVALAADAGVLFVTADARLLQRIGQSPNSTHRDIVIELGAAARRRSS